MDVSVMTALRMASRAGFGTICAATGSPTRYSEPRRHHGRLRDLVEPFATNTGLVRSLCAVAWAPASSDPVPRSQPDRITVNARCLDDVDGPSLKPLDSSMAATGRKPRADGLPKEDTLPLPG